MNFCEGYDEKKEGDNEKMEFYVAPEVKKRVLVGDPESLDKIFDCVED